MKLRLLTLPLLALACPSCDKAKNLANKARSAVESNLAEKTGESHNKPDPELEKLVDKNAEGAVFRKDLPFPQRVEVRTTTRNEQSSRQVSKSEIGNQALTIKGTQTTVTKCERSGNQVRYTLERSEFLEFGKEPEKDKNGKPKEKGLPVGLSAKPMLFNKSGNSWRADGAGDFRSVAVSKQLSPVFDVLLVHNGLAPRPLWFGKRRLKPGDEVAVAADTLPMLIAGNAKGSFKLTLESFEAVAGHPCGVFAVTGDFSRKDFPSFEGDFTSEDVTIQSGKLWLSLIYPLVLREELDTIQTYRSGGQGNLSTRVQGAVKASITREWKGIGS